MRRQFLTASSSSLVLIALVLSKLALAQSTASWAAPRTEHGYPDLQGNWTNPYQTPLERPAELGTQRAYSPEEARELISYALQLDAARMAPLDPGRPAPQAGDRINNQADGNFETMPTELAVVDGEIRTSFVIDPENGRIPRLSTARDIYAQWRTEGKGRFDGPEALTPLDRCLNPGGQLPLMYIFGGVGHPQGNPAGDNPVRNIQIVQNKDYAVILAEYFSLVRIVRLKGDHLVGQGRKWMGDSVGYYEGDSLVVNTRYFRPEQSIGPMRSSIAFAVEEHYTRTGEDEILFQYTVTDANIYSQPFTVQIPLRRMAAGQRLYEYACHEGNYSIPSMLRAARMEEQGLLN